MMKTRNTYINRPAKPGHGPFGVRLAAVLLLSAAMFLNGCGSEEFAFPDGGEKPSNELVPIKVSAGISAGVEVAGATDAPEGPQTRAAAMINTNGARMGVFRVADAAKGYTAQNNVEYTYSTATNSWSNAASPILVSGLVAQLCAYYPFGSATFSGTAATLTAQKYDAAKDLCYASNATAEVTNKAPSASFAMKRAYSRVSLTIRRDASYENTCAITNVTFRNGSTGSFYSSATVNIATGSVSPGSASSTGTDFNPGIASIASGATDTTADYLLPPQSVGSGLSISLTVDGVVRSIVVPAGQFSSNSLAGGSRYVIKLAVTGASIVITSVNITSDYTSGGDAVSNPEV